MAGIPMIKLALGTAQFGLHYGINNHTGQVSVEAISQILAAAQQTGVNTLDTAIAYGESEHALGQNDLTGFNLITKLPAFPENCASVKQWVKEQVVGSLTRLNIKQLDAVLLHRPEQLLQSQGLELYQALQQLKQDGLCRRLGVSVYAPAELEPIFARFKFDIVQLPMNVFDQRLIDSGWLSRLHEHNIAVHVRSLFLQGLLLMPEHQRPIIFNAWQPHWQRWQQWLQAQGLSPLEGCLRPFLAQPAIEKLVVGVDSLMQLQEILAVFNQPALPIPKSLSCHDEKLLNPSLWSK